MKSRRGFFLGCLAACCSLAALAAAPTTNKVNAAAARAAKQSEEIATKIDGLLKRRLAPDLLPRNLPNPFAVVTGVVTAPQEDAESSKAVVAPSPASPPAATDAPLSTAEILARCAAGLKFGGIIRQDGQVHIVINNVPHKEGDMVVANQGNMKVYFRIVRITAGEITIRLDDVEQTVRY